MGSAVRWFVEVKCEQDIEDAVKEAHILSCALLILGKGCNTIFSDAKDCLPVFVIYIQNKGITKISEDNTSVIFEVKSGEDWDSFVEYTVNQSLSGIEALSHIPSSVGATPVQNVGAYGQEVCQTIESVRVFDLQEHTWKDITNKDCDFNYRMSIFKGTERNRYIIESVVFKLLKQSVYALTHAELKKYFENSEVKPTPLQIRKAIIEIRSRKLPDPKVLPNCGSFFENVIVTSEVAKNLLTQYNNMPQYPEKDGRVKLSTGWMIDSCGLKGYTHKNVSVSSQNALVLTHNRNGSYVELAELEELIVKAVKTKFGVTIEREPNVIC